MLRSVSKSDIKVFKNVNLLTMVSDQILYNQYLIIKNDVILDFGPLNNLIIPENAEIIEGGNAYLMPGLADMHAHYVSQYEPDSFFNLLLKNGVTTVRLYQSFPNDSVLVWKQQIKQGTKSGPDLFVCGFLFNDDSPDISPLKENHSNYDIIKIYDGVGKKAFHRILKSARENHIYTVGHIPFRVGLDDFIKQGMNEIAHVGELGYELVPFNKGFFSHPTFGSVISQWVDKFYTSGLTPEQALQNEEPALDKIVEKVKKSGMMITPTLIVPTMIQEQLYNKDRFLSRPELKYALPGFLEEYNDGQNTYDIQLKSLIKQVGVKAKGDDGHLFIQYFLGTSQMFVKKLNDAGVPLLLSTDTPALTVAIIPGYSAIEELELYVAAGLSPYEALKTGTVNAGIAEERMTGHTTIGTIEKGKKANLILIKNNPLESVSNLRKPEGVMIRGHYYNQDDLNNLPVVIKKTLVLEIKRLIKDNCKAESIYQFYLDFKKSGADTLLISENDLNEYGYELLNQGKKDESIEVFRINSSEYPDSWNAYDSLAEAFLKKGNLEEAKINYQKSLNLNSGNKSARKFLKR